MASRLYEALKDAHGRRVQRNSHDAPSDWVIPVDILEGESGLTVRAHLAAASLDEIGFRFDGRRLTITGNTCLGQVRTSEPLLCGAGLRVVHLPDAFDPEAAQVVFKDRVLELFVPRGTAKGGTAPPAGNGE